MSVLWTCRFESCLPHTDFSTHGHMTSLTCVVSGFRCVPPVCCVACQLGIWSTFPPFRCPRGYSFLFSLSSLGFDAAAVLVGLRCVLFGEQHYQRCKDAHLGLNEACLSLSVPSLRLSLQPNNCPAYPPFPSPITVCMLSQFVLWSSN